MRYTKNYHIGYNTSYHYEGRLYPEDAPFWVKFWVMLGEPIVVNLVVSYVCYLLGGNAFLDMYGFMEFLMEPVPGAFLISFAFIWVAVILFRGGRIAEEQVGPNKKLHRQVTAKIDSITTFGDSSGSPKDTTHEVRVSYTVNGVDYDNVLLNYYNNRMVLGGSIELTIDPTRPDQPVQSGGEKILYILGVSFMIAATAVTLLMHYAQ